MTVSVILTTLRKSSRFRDALSKVGQNNIEFHDHTSKSQQQEFKVPVPLEQMK